MDYAKIIVLYIVLILIILFFLFHKKHLSKIVTTCDKYCVPTCMNKLGSSKGVECQDKCAQECGKL